MWRMAVVEDEPAIERLRDEQERRFGQDFPSVKSSRAPLFDPESNPDTPFYPFRPPIVRVRVEEREGVIVACRIVEAITEVQLIGGDQETVKSLGKELPEECQWARRCGFHSGWGLVPKELAKPIARALRHSPLRLWPSLALIGCDFAELGD